MSRIITQTDIVIEIIKSPEELVELAQSLLKLAYGSEAAGISLNLGLGFYGSIEQSFQIRFINENQLEVAEEDEEDDDESFDAPEIADEVDETEDGIDENALASSLLDIFAGMGFVVLGGNENGIVLSFPDDLEIDPDTGVVIPECESELTSTEPPVDHSDVSHLYSGQV